MASGKKNYFRHSTNAFEDEKIQHVIDNLGYEGYAYYFILIELLARKCENEFINPITIHQQSLRNVWRKHSKSCVKVVKKLEESGLFVATFNKSLIEFDIPNLAKYMGKYQIKKSPNVPNKSKVKESKVKESKGKENKEKITPDEIIQIFNDTLGKDVGYCRGLGSGKHIDNFLEANQWLETKESWQELFDKCKGNDVLMGVDGKWRVNLTWLVNYDNALKVLNGNYSGNAKKNKFEWTPSDDVLRACGELD